MSAPLDTEFYALPFPTQAALAALREAGVTDESLRDERCFPKSAWVRPVEPNRFEFDPEGVEVVVLACLSEWEEVDDLIAFRPGDPGKVRSYDGRAVFLGEHVVANPATYAFQQPLRVFRDPLGWLKAGGQGAVILDKSRVWRRLLDVPAIAAEDELHAKELASLRKPQLCRVMFEEAA